MSLLKKEWWFVGAMLILLIVCSALAGCQTSTSTHRSNPSTTYAVNGLAGGLPGIGYGMRNLCPKVDCKLYAHTARSTIVADIKKWYRPGRKVVLIGHSLGGNRVTQIAAQIYPIPVHYMAVIDAPKPREITKNVRAVDNFLSNLSTVGKVLSRGQKIKLSGVGHIALGDHPEVHSRIIRRSR